MNWVQRLLLMVAGLFLLLFAFDAGTDGYDSDGWLALAMFLAAVGCFFFAATPKRKPSDG